MKCNICQKPIRWYHKKKYTHDMSDSGVYHDKCYRQRTSYRFNPLEQVRNLDTVVFEGRWRNWNPLPGHKPPEGKVFELIAILEKEDVYVCGNSIQQAWDRLLLVLDHRAR